MIKVDKPRQGMEDALRIPEHKGGKPRRKIHWEVTLQRSIARICEVLWERLVVGQMSVVLGFGQTWL